MVEIQCKNCLRQSKNLLNLYSLPKNTDEGTNVDSVI